MQLNLDDLVFKQQAADKENRGSMKAGVKIDMKLLKTEQDVPRKIRKDGMS